MVVMAASPFSHDVHVPEGVRPSRASLVMSAAALLVPMVLVWSCRTSRDTRPADLVFDPTIAC
jgi:hypothetical protein